MSSGGLRKRKQGDEVRQNIVKMLKSAGWSVEYRQRKGRQGYSDAVYVDGLGKTHWSVTLAYHKLQEKIENGTANEMEVSSFALISAEDLSLISRKSAKKIRNAESSVQPRNKDEVLHQPDNVVVEAQATEREKAQDESLCENAQKSRQEAESTEMEKARDAILQDIAQSADQEVEPSAEMEKKTQDAILQDIAQPADQDQVEPSTEMEKADHQFIDFSKPQHLYIGNERVEAEDPESLLKKFVYSTCTRPQTADVVLDVAIPGAPASQLLTSPKELAALVRTRTWVPFCLLYIWMSHVYERMTKVDRKRVQIAPWPLSSTGNPSAVDLVNAGSVANFMKLHPAQLYLIPYLLGGKHWELLAIVPSRSAAYSFYSFNTPGESHLSNFVERLGTLWCSSGKIKREPSVWKLVTMTHKFQSEIWDHGYYIMNWMERIALDIKDVDIQQHFPGDNATCDAGMMQHMYGRLCAKICEKYLADWTKSVNQKLLNN